MVDTQLTKQYFDEQFDVLTRAVKEGFDATATKTELDGVKTELDGVKQRLTRVESTMVTKSYLDDKLADLKGDLIVKMRKLEGGLQFLASVLRERKVLSDADVQRMRSEYQIFPSVA